MPESWDHIREQRFSKDPSPTEWPSGVRPISLKGVSLLGVHEETSKLYWDGQELAIKNRIRFGWVERVFAALIALGTFGTFVLMLGTTLEWWGT